MRCLLFEGRRATRRTTGLLTLGDQGTTHDPGGLLNKRLRQFVQLVDLYPTILDTFALEPPPGTHGKSLMPLVLGGNGEHVGLDVACYGRFGESLNVTDGEWTLFIWPPSQNTPLYWHSQLPPQFGPYKLAGSFEKNGRFPVSCAREETKTQLFKVSKDPQQLRDRAQINRRSWQH